MTGANAPPGAQRERTALAWRRTALTFAGNGILLTRASDTRIVVAAFALLALAAGLAAASAMTFRDRETHGWIVAAEGRADLLMFLGAAVSLLDIVAIFNWRD